MTMDSPADDEAAGEGSGLTTAGVPDFFDGKDPEQFTKDYFDLRMAQGATREDIAGESLNIRARAAMAGDKRVIVES